MIRHITDWQLDEELQQKHPIYVVAFANRVLRSHQHLIARLQAAGVSFQLVDIAEHPSIIERRDLKRRPVVHIYVEGVRVAHWERTFDVREVRAAVEFLSRAHQNGPSD